MRKLLLSFFGIACMLNSQANDTLYVALDGVPFSEIDGHQSWETPTSDLQTAIDSLYSVGGGQVWVKAGIYYPTKGNDRDSSFFLRDHVQLYGSFLGNEASIAERQQLDINENDSIEPWEFSYLTILSGDIGIPGDSLDNSHHIINGSYTDSLTLVDGFKIMDSYCIISGEAGGGAWLAHLNRCIIENNYAKSGGGLFLCSATQCLLRGNKAQWGGGAANSDLSYCLVESNMADYGGGVIGGSTYRSVLRNNRAFFMGGGVHRGFVSHSEISSNYSVNQGGGLSDYMVSDTSSAVFCRIFNNIGLRGGGAYNYTLKNCYVMNNFAGFMGGGLYLGEATNSLIANNTSQTKYGAVYDTDLTNCTIANNNSLESIWCISGTRLKNCILWNNYVDYDNTPDIQYCFSNQTSFIVYTGGSNHEISEDNEVHAKFTLPADSIGRVCTQEGIEHVYNADWTLQNESFCIDRGYEGYLDPDTVYDLAGNPRLVDQLDLGAFENQKLPNPDPNENTDYVAPYKANQFKVYPTFTQGELFISSNGSEVLNKIVIYNSAGIIVYQKAGISLSGKLDVSNLSPGVYWISATSHERIRETYNIIKW